MEKLQVRLLGDRGVGKGTLVLGFVECGFVGGGV